MAMTDEGKAAFNSFLWGRAGGECRISMIEVLMNGRYDRRWWGVPY